MDDKYFIPRNAINVDDTFPFEFIVHIEIQKRQIPYILIGTAITAIAITNLGNIIPIIVKIMPSLVSKIKAKQVLYNITTETLFTITKGAVGIISIGLTYGLSYIKKENQYIEQLINNSFKYHLDKIKFKIERSESVEKNIKSRIIKFKIKKSRNEKCNNINI